MVREITSTCGVYMLCGIERFRPSEWKQVVFYIGEGANVYARLAQHRSDSGALRNLRAFILYEWENHVDRPTRIRMERRFICAARHLGFHLLNRNNGRTAKENPDEIAILKQVQQLLRS